MKPWIALVGLMAVSYPKAFAFHVPEHVKITSRAVEELRKCGLLPATWGPDWTQSVVSADEGEDYNLVRKWSKYSHYYNPNHPLDQYRADSSLSVSESATEIQAAHGEPFLVNELIGRIIHHVQDSSVPAHAVPVAHSNKDGFEVFDLSGYYAEPVSPAICPQLAALEPMKVLHDNALDTLQSLSGDVELVRVGGTKVEERWLGAFWSLGKGNAFGQYGDLGNSFGAAEVALPNGGKASVDPAQYSRLKRERVEAAVRATEAVILWANRVRGI